MEAHLIEMLGMLLRWLHVIAGIAWVGSSFYFIWLDGNLDPVPPGSEEAGKGVSGELWAVHGGGFYNSQKYAVAPARHPEKIHWFKWEAYTTWLSGTALLVIVYWMRAQAMMVDPTVSGLTPAQAVGVGAASMIVSWCVYDLLCRSPLGRRNRVGVAIGTIMAANVIFVIIPGQKRMVAAMRAGRTPDPADGARGRQRSVHNNYFTLPVVFIMISNHYAATYGHPHAWAVLALISAAGVLIRHFFNRRHKGARPWRYLAVSAVLFGAVAVWTAPHIQALPPVKGPVTLDRVRSIVGQRCVMCHSQAPTFPGITQPPAGVVLQGAAGIVQNAQRIYQQVVVTRIMPLGNASQMTDDERAVIAAWVTAGAPAQ